MKNKWYLSTTVIALLFAFWFFIIPLIIGIVLLIKSTKQNKQNIASYQENENQLKKLSVLREKIGFQRYEDVTAEIETIREKFTDERNSLQKEISDLRTNKENEIAQKEKQIENLNKIISQNTDSISEQKKTLEELSLSKEKRERQIENQTKKLSRIKELQRSIYHAVDRFIYYLPLEDDIKIPENDLTESDQISPSVILKLHSMDVKELRKAFKDNDREINELLSKYSSRYTTKANIAIYKLMVIALRSELQNILYNLKYEKLDRCIAQVKEVTEKYLKIAGDGNQSIAGTLTKFIGQIEYLFINAVKIEYNYYVKREQAKQEQKAIREQMRQEAAERKALENERKKIEQEEDKFNSEIQKLNAQLSSAPEDEIEILKSRILELQSQLADVVVKKEEITTLAQGKAGNVYIISNVGSFGDNVFKIGMTRRLNPQDRVDELGSASVPFKFDVHSFIFSDDAVALENKLHEILNDKRVNKVNMRKEFFRTNIDDLEKIVNDIDPTAEFKRTILAEEFRQSLNETEIDQSQLLSNSTPVIA